MNIEVGDLVTVEYTTWVVIAEGAKGWTLARTVPMGCVEGRPLLRVDGQLARALSGMASPDVVQQHHERLPAQDRLVFMKGGFWDAEPAPTKGGGIDVTFTGVNPTEKEIAAALNAEFKKAAPPEPVLSPLARARALRPAEATPEEWEILLAGENERRGFRPGTNPNDLAELLVNHMGRLSGFGRVLLEALRERMKPAPKTKRPVGILR